MDPIAASVARALPSCETYGDGLKRWSEDSMGLQQVPRRFKGLASRFLTAGMRIRGMFPK